MGRSTIPKDSKSIKICTSGQSYPRRRVVSSSYGSIEVVSLQWDSQPVTDLVELISELNVKVGRYGIGRFSSLEHLESGEKVLEVREAPAATLILEAFAQLASATVDVETIRWMRTLGEALIMEAVEGRWFRGLRQALQSFLEECAHRVSGDVRFTLRNGAFELAGLKAEAPLYIRDREQWEFAKAAAARSVTTSRWLDAGLEHRLNGAEPSEPRECLPRDAAAHRLSPESRLPAPPGDPNSTTSLD